MLTGNQVLDAGKCREALALKRALGCRAAAAWLPSVDPSAPVGRFVGNCRQRLPTGTIYPSCRICWTKRAENVAVGIVGKVGSFSDSLLRSLAVGLVGLALRAYIDLLSYPYAHALSPERPVIQK